MDVRRGLVAVGILVLSSLLLIYCSFGNKVASAQVKMKANLPTGTAARGSNYNYQVLPGSQRQISVNLTGGTVNLVNWSISSSTGGATAILDRGANAIGVTNVTIGPTAGSCTVSGTLGAYSVNSPATVTVQAQSVDDPSQVASFLFKVCAPTTTVKVSPGYQQAYIGQPVELQSFVIGNTNEAGTWAITSNPKNAGKILDNNKRDTVFSATAVGRYALTYTSAADPTKTSTAYVYVAGPQPSYGLVTANLTMAVPCEKDPDFKGKTYEVGPSQTYKTINAVPLMTWSPGSIVRIHNEDTSGRSPTTYHETARIAGQGTATQPLMFCGVPDATGQLPVMDGANSTSAVGNSGSQEYGIINIWGPNGSGSTYIAGSNGPDYTIVSGIRIINGRNTYTFTPAGGTGTKAFNDFCSGIRVKHGQFVTLIGNDIQNNGNGIFVQNNSAGGFSQVTLFTTIRGNRIREAGISGGPGINSSGSHGIYTQAYYPVVEANRLESLVLNSGGNLIKDRGLESIHRYNYAVTTEGGYLVGMESATDAQPYNAFEPWLGGIGETDCGNSTYCAYEKTITADQVAAFSESLEKVYMYGNIYSSRSNQFLADFKLSDSGGGGGYVWANQTEMGDHLGTTYFYQNTVDSPPFAVFGTLSGGNNGSDPEQQPLKPTVFAANNIFYLPKTGSISIFSLTRNASIIGKWQTNLFNKGTVDNTLPINGKPATNLASVFGWQDWNDNLQYPGVLPIDGHNSGITPAGTGNFLETDKQNHQPYNPVTFAPVSGAGATGIGTPITDPQASLLPVRFQYIVDTGALIPRTTLTTVGAVDTGKQPSLTAIAVRPDTASFLSQTGTCNYGPAAFDYPGACLPSRMGVFYTPVPLRFLGTFSDGSSVDVSPLVTLSAADLTFHGNSAFTANRFAPLKGLVAASLNGLSIQVPYAFDGATPPAPSTATITSVMLNPGSLALVAGGSAQLAATALYSDGSSTTCSASSWTSTQPAIVSVSGTGLVTAGSAGTASVTAACGGIASSPATVTVNVPQPTITSVNISPRALALTVGGTSQLAAMATYSDASVAACEATSWTSLQPAIASVSGGRVTAVAKGTTSISAVCGNVGSAPATMTISAAKPIITLVTILPVALSLTVGGTSQMMATATYSDASTAACTPTAWTSTQPAIASVSGGRVTAIATGTASITAVCENVPSAAAAVTVSPPKPTITSVSIAPGSLALTVGDTIQLTATAIYSDASTASCSHTSWASSTPLKASVSGSGLITAIAKGTTAVTATCSNVVSSPATVTVSAPKPTVASVMITPGSLALTVGETSPLLATATYSDSTTATCTTTSWKSSTPLMASVSGTGVVTAVAKGTSAVTAVCDNISSLPVAVKVSAAKPTVTSVKITPSALALTIGDTSSLTATATYSDSTTSACTTVSWYSTVPRRASVSASGLVTAIAKGGAGIKAVCDSIVSPPITVIVRPAKPTVASVMVTPGSLTLAVGGSSQLMATATYSDSTTATCTPTSWNSGTPLMASVSSSGLVKAIAKGTAMVTAVCNNIASPAVAVTINAAKPTITAVSVTPTSIALGVGETLQLTATATYSDASTAACTPTSWNSSLPRAATVSNSGLVTAIAKGTVAVTAVCDSVASLPAALTVTVGKATITAVALSPSTLTLKIGTVAQLVATATYSDGSTAACTPTTWNSTAPLLASISSSGQIAAIGAGAVTFSAVCGGIASSPAALTVSSAAPTLTSVTITPTTTMLDLGADLQFTATEVYSDTTTKVCSSATWLSSATDIATVTNAGLVSAVAVGNTALSATCQGLTSPPSNLQVRVVPITHWNIRPAQ